MRSVICWIVAWMMLIGLVIAANSSGEWAKELEAVSQAPFIFVGAFIALYAVIVIPGIAIISKDTTKTMEAKYEGEIKALKATLEGETKQNKRLETKIAELEKQLLNQSSPLPQSLLKPVSVVEVSEVNQETPRLLPAVSSRNDPSQIELKIQAHQTANEIYQAIEKAKRQAGMRAGEIGHIFLYEDWSIDPRGQKYIDIVNSVLTFYSERIHEKAIALKLKIDVPADQNIFPIRKYTNPQGLRDLEAITKDLKDIGT